MFFDQIIFISMQFFAEKIFLNEVEVMQGKQEIIRKKKVIDVLDC